MVNFRLAKIVFLALILTFAADTYAQKMSAEEVIAKHLDSIGAKESRANIKNQLVVGNVQINQKGSANVIYGKALILSAGDKNMWAMNLTSNDYPQDRFGFDGRAVRVGFARPGAYSDIGRFIRSYEEIVKEGLLGGTLSSSWALLDTNPRNAKVSYEGTKKVNGKETVVLSFSPKGGSDLTIKMFFDRQTFQHVRTEYNRLISARGGGSIDTSASAGESRYRLIEEFSNYQKAGDLTLPTSYKLFYSFYNGDPIQARANPNRELELKFELNSFTFNEPLEQNAFDTDGQ
jgi:hypothetical protein